MSSSEHLHSTICRLAWDRKTWTLFLEELKKTSENKLNEVDCHFLFTSLWLLYICLFQSTFVTRLYICTNRRNSIYIFHIYCKQISCLSHGHSTRSRTSNTLYDFLCFLICRALWFDEFHHWPTLQLGIWKWSAQLNSNKVNRCFGAYRFYDCTNNVKFFFRFKFIIGICMLRVFLFLNYGSKSNLQNQEFEFCVDLWKHLLNSYNTWIIIIFDSY